jgi:hypothetical protein
MAPCRDQWAEGREILAGAFHLAPLTPIMPCLHQFWMIASDAFTPGRLKP